MSYRQQGRRKRDGAQVTIKWWGCLLISFGCGLAFGAGLALIEAIF